MGDSGRAHVWTRTGQGHKHPGSVAGARPHRHRPDRDHRERLASIAADSMVPLLDVT